MFLLIINHYRLLLIIDYYMIIKHMYVLHDLIQFDFRLTQLIHIIINYFKLLLTVINDHQSYYYQINI